jgi:TrmH RNA methyltransferase
MSKKINGLMTKETRIYGENACLAVFKKRPQDIIQVFLTKELMKKLPQITKYCVQNKKAYHLVLRSELESMTKATHHEDICMLIKQGARRSLENFLSIKPESCLILALENVANPHNIGAILRSAAHFGATAILVSDIKTAESASSLRTSEGGSEFVEIFEAKDFKAALLLLSKNKFQIVATSSHAKNNLFDLKWEKKVVVLFGEEAEGLTPELLKLGTTVKIPGTDNVESLNVSVASALILSDYYQKVKLNEINPRFK